MRHAHPFQKLRQHRRRKARLALVEVAGQQLDRQQPAPFQLVQHRQQRVAVLAARQADQPLAGVAASDHAVLLDRLAHVAHDPLAQLVELGRRGRTGEQRVDIVGVVQH